MADPAGPDDVVSETREMSITHAEFYRLLPRIIPGATVQRLCNGARFEMAGGVVEIILGPEESRKIASMVLPRTSITLAFSRFEAEAMDEFRRRFEVTFQKGGG